MSGVAGAACRRPFPTGRKAPRVARHNPQIAPPGNRGNTAAATMPDEPPPAADGAEPPDPDVPARPGLSGRIWIPLLGAALVLLLLAVDRAPVSS